MVTLLFDSMVLGSTLIPRRIVNCQGRRCKKKLEMDQNIRKEDFEQICRLCLRRLLSSKVLIFEEPTSNGQESVSVPELIEYCINIEVSQNDQLPKFICTVCKNDLLEYTKFRRKCFKSKEKLEIILKEHEELNFEILYYLKNMDEMIYDESQSNNENQFEEQDQENTQDYTERYENSKSSENFEKTIKNDDSCNSSDLHSLYGFKCVSEDDMIQQSEKQEQSELSYEYNLEDKNNYGEENNGVLCSTNIENKFEMESEDDALHDGDDTVNNEYDVLNYEEDTLNDEENTLNNQEDTLNSEDVTLKVEESTSNGDEDFLNGEEDSLNIEEDTLNAEEDPLNYDKKFEIIHSDSRNDDSPMKQKNKIHIKKYKKYNTQKKLRQCQVCGKMYPRLNHHMLTHKDVKRYKCTICSQSYRSNCNLKQHMLIHTNERPFKCTQCDKAFNWKKSLKAHELHHSQEKNYQCNVCGMKLRYISSIDYHKKLHFQIFQHKCDICSKEFLTKTKLTRHYRIHTGEKAYECKECGKKFMHNSNYYNHKKKHANGILIK